MTNKNYLFILAAALILSGCDDNPEEKAAKAEHIIDCAFNKNAQDKATACNSLNESEKRILNCAVKAGDGSRKERCKSLSEAELELIPRIDAARPKGTHFEFNTRKLGE